jgi:hypothetical protein
MKEVKSLGRFGNVHVKMGWMMNGRLLLRACEFLLEPRVSSSADRGREILDFHLSLENFCDLEKSALNFTVLLVSCHKY